MFGTYIFFDNSKYLAELFYFRGFGGEGGIRTLERGFTPLLP